jgi:hypothetical protein
MPLEQGVEDDRTILDEHHLWRRIPKWHLAPDQNARGIRVSSAAFDDDPDGNPMSVVLGDELLSSGRAAEEALRGLPEFGLVSITAALARERGQKIIRAPSDDEPAHALVVGSKTRSVMKAFARAATWVIPPPGGTILALDRVPPEWTAGLSADTAHTLLLPRRNQPGEQRPPAQNA